MSNEPMRLDRAHAERIATERHEYAETILVHYFKAAARGAWTWDLDNAAELGAAVDAIIEAATFPLEARIADLEADVVRMLEMLTEDGE